LNKLILNIWLEGFDQILSIIDFVEVFDWDPGNPENSGNPGVFKLM
jgi:hypothetical protein